MPRGDKHWSDALRAMQDFKNNRNIPRTTGSPVFINTGRLVEMYPDGEVMEVQVFENHDFGGHLFIEHEAIQVLAADRNKIRHVFNVDDRNGGKIPRMLKIRKRDEQGLILDAQEMDWKGNWKQLGGTTKGGVFFTYAEWDQIKEYSRLWHAYHLAYQNKKDD